CKQKSGWFNADNGGSSTDANGRANSHGNLRYADTRAVAYNGAGDYYRY
ncbi:MAG: hypothetical protein GX664_01335, partial [Bacteroidales bacterium]|nr:hypothetical protein [Bacteroidales bacterium]